MQWYSMLLIASVALGFIHQHCFALVQFTNIKCIPDDPKYVNFAYCYLKSVNRSYKYLSLNATLLNRYPINIVTTRFKIWKRENGYKPFLYDYTFDACKFLRSRKNKVISFLHDFFREYSNMNHTCPYSDYIAVDKLPVSHINNMLTNVLPAPAGEYMFDSRWILHNTLRATVKIYATFA